MPIIQFKRRNTGLSEPPTGLKTGEPAYNAIGEILYLGHGDDGSGNAIASRPVGGRGAFVDFITAQTIGGVKTFSQIPQAPTPAPGTNDASVVNAAFVQNAFAGYATLASPALSGVPTAPTPDPGDNTTKIATTAFVFGAMSVKANIASPVFTGNPEAPTQSQGDNSTKLATTAYVDNGLLTRAALLSPVFTGTPLAPTATPGTSNTQIATTAFVESRVVAAQAGLDPKNSCLFATTENISLSGTQTVDGVSTGTGRRGLVKNQTDATENGIYITSNSAWTRATDADGNEEVTTGMFCYVEQGTINEGTTWVLVTPDPIVVGTTGLEFTTMFGGGGLSPGAGIDIIAGAVSVEGFTAMTNNTLAKKSGTAFVSAVAGTDYLSPDSAIDGGTF